MPREPTLAQQRAREQAARREQQAEDARREQMERQARRRRKLLIGGSAVAGVAAVVAVGYTLSRPDDTVARCVGPDNVVVDDRNCAAEEPGPAVFSYERYDEYQRGGRSWHYHYTYGGSGDLGTVATGGTTVPPRSGTVHTSSGRTLDVRAYGGRNGSGSVRRGGFGSGPGSGGSGRSGGG